MGRSRAALVAAALAALPGAFRPAGGGEPDAALLPAPAETAVTRTAPAKALLLWPSLGRPAFVAPGGSLRVIARMPPAERTPVFSLVYSGVPQHRHLLAGGPGAGESLSSGTALALGVPANIPPGTYDLEIRWGAAGVVGRHCVAVGRVAERVRFVHLSNMNVGDVGAPDFDGRLIDEVNLVCPTVIVATGDYLDATHAAPARGWQRLVDFLTRFDAPLVLACGDHDDMALYSRFVAPSPIGIVGLGPCRGVVLLDHADNPIDRDARQLDWVERVLTRSGPGRLTFIVSHAESPNLLRYWRSRGTLERMVGAAQLGLWFAGGHRDWDGQEYGDLLAAAEPMLYLRTHQSSTAVQGGAEGVSHYRVVDLVGQRVTLPGQTGGARATASIPVGRLGVELDGPNDGTRSELAFTATNNLSYRMDGLALRVLLQRQGNREPWCHGATLERATPVGSVWDCRVRFDLPDKGSLRGVVGCTPEPPRSNIQIEGDLPARLQLTSRVSGDGVAFYSAASAAAFVTLRNRGAQATVLRPLIRLDGDRLAYRPVNGGGPFATAYRLRLGPGERITLELDLSALRVRPGRRELQVYLMDRPAWAPVCYPLSVEVVGPEALAGGAGGALNRAVLPFGP